MSYDGKDRRAGLSSRATLAVWGLGAGLLGGLISSLIAFSAINWWTRISVVGSTDAVAIANTYIVYTTFVIAAVAAVLTVAGLIFTQHFATEKEAHLASAFEALLDLVQDDDGKAGALGKQIMDHPDVIRYVQQLLQDKVTEEIKRRQNIAYAKVATAKVEADAVAEMNEDLFDEPKG